MNDTMRMKRQFSDLLSTAQQLRPMRPNPAEWGKFERSVMLDAVNVERAKRSLDPVTEAQLEKVEQQAVGHVDYSSKFALYCAWLALGQEELIKP